MKAFLRLIVLPLSVLAISCDGPVTQEVPQAICGTPVDRDLVRPLLASTAELHESSRVDRKDAVTAPCLVLSADKVVLRLRFSWDDSVPDLMYVAANSGTVSGVTDPRRIDFSYETVAGTDGAISTAPCKTKGGNHFTLTFQLPQVRQQDRTHRKDIERFMRAYFPATLKTLGCEREGPDQRGS
jgi:hypothetical protein